MISLQCKCQIRLMIDQGDVMIPKPIKSHKKTNKKETTTERCDPLCSEIPQWLQEFRENLVDDRVPESRDSHASSSHEASLEPTTKRREDLGEAQCSYSFPQKTEIARSVKGPKLQRLHADDALAEPYFVQKNLVT